MDRQTTGTGPTTPMPFRMTSTTSTTAPHGWSYTTTRFNTPIRSRRGSSPAAPPSNQQTEKKAAGPDDAVCFFYAKGMCKSALKCKRLHRLVPIKPAAASEATVCKYYLLEQGCNRGELCEFRHFVLPP